MTIQSLDACLQIVDGKLTVSPDTLPGNPLKDFFALFNGNQPLVITDAVKTVPPLNDYTVIIKGEASVLRVHNLAVEAVFVSHDGQDVNATLHYTFIDPALPDSNPWRFSQSFPNIPVFPDMKSDTEPFVPFLDTLQFQQAFFIWTNAEQTSDSRTGTPLSAGMNFVGTFAPSGFIGLLDAALSGNPTITLYGTVTLPTFQSSVTPLLPSIYPWEVEGTLPGILLQGDLGIDMQLLNSSLHFHQTHLHLYAPTDSAWQQSNKSFVAQTAVSGKLDIPLPDSDQGQHANGDDDKISITVTARVSPQAKRLSLYAKGTNLSLANLGRLTGLAGGNDLFSQLPQELQQVGETLGGLSLEAVAVSFNGSLAPSSVLITVGMPTLHLNALEYFELEKLYASFAISQPFSSNRSLLVTLGGTLDAFDASFDGSVELPSLWTRASLKKDTVLPLHSMFSKIGLPAPPDLTINRMDLSLMPGDGYTFDAVFAEDPKWSLDVGPVPLTISNVQLHIAKFSGSTTGSLGGALAFGNDLFLTAVYDLSGMFMIRADIPEIRLMQLISQMTNQTVTLPGGFDLDFQQSYVIIQLEKQQYIFQFATTLVDFGTFAFEARKIDGQNWGFAAGLDLSTGKLSDLPALSSLSMFEDLFHLQKLLLVVSSFDDPGFAFPDLSQFDNPQIAGGRLSLPGQGGVIAGLNLYAEWVINTEDKQQNLLMTLLGTHPTIGITLQVGVNPQQNSKLYVSYETEIEKLPLSCQFGGQISAGSVGLFLKGSMAVNIQNQVQTFSVELDFVENGAFISASMKGNTPIDFDVFKLGNLALVIGVDWEGIPSLGVAGTIAAGEFESSIAVFFDSAEPQKSMVAGALSDLSLKDVLQTLTGDIIPSDIDDVLSTVAIQGTHTFQIPANLADALDNMQLDQIAQAFHTYGQITIPTTINQVFFNKEVAGQVWFLTDLSNKMKHYEIRINTDHTNIDVSLEAQFYCVPQRTQLGNLPPFDPDVYINGQINFLGFHATATIDISYNKGIAIDASMDRIAIGQTLFVIESVDGMTGPSISVATYDQPNQANAQYQKPHFCINGRMSLLGLKREIYVNLTSAGLKFDINGQILPFLYMQVEGNVDGTDGLEVGGDIKVGIDTIDLGPLGTIDIGTDVEGKLDIGANSSKLWANLQAGFQFAGNGFSLPITLDVTTDALANIAKTVWEKVKEALLTYLSDAAVWAECAAKKFIQGVKDIVQVLQEQFHKTLDEAKKIAANAIELAEKVAKSCAMTTAAGIM